MPQASRDYILRAASQATVAMKLGNYDLAEAALRRVLPLIDDQSYGSQAGRKSMLGDDASAFYTGEMHEKAMMAFYFGLLRFRKGDVAEARTGFQMALRWDQHSVDEAYRDDMALVHQMLAYAFMRLGDEGNARIALSKAATALGRTEPLKPAEVARHNVIILVEMGIAPYKDPEATGTRQFRPIQYPESAAVLEVDGREIGRLSAGVDFLYQATTRGTTTRDRAETAKRVTAELLSFVPYGLLVTGLMRATGWSRSDMRSWSVLPGEIHSIGAELTPGVHALAVHFEDENGRRVSRMSRRLPRVSVPRAGEPPLVVLLTSPSTDRLLEAPTPDTEENKTIQLKTRVRREAGHDAGAVCFDTVGHRDGATPFWSGGGCFCTPTEDRLRSWQRAGACVGNDLEAVKAELREAGIDLPGPGHETCAGLCEHGPHVALGGRCLAAPPPGSPAYDRILTLTGLGAGRTGSIETREWRTTR